MQKQKRYSEEQGKEIIDWYQVIQDLRSGKIVRNRDDGSYTFEFQNIIERATSWVTCACGNQCSIIPRYPNGTPKDNQLWWAGAAFPTAITHGRGDDYKQALALLNRIEVRSAELIKEILTSNAIG